MSSQFLVEKRVSKQRINDSRLLDYANQHRNMGFFNDVLIKVGEECFPANRMVLSCYSKYFENMFKTQMRERYENSVEIQFIEKKSMKIIIEYIYTGNIVIDNENVSLLLSAADYLVIDEVKQYCFEFLESIITPDNCIDILNAAYLYDNDSLESKVNETIEENLFEISQSTSLKYLTKANLFSCICKLNRSNIQETLLYEVIIAWIKHDPDERRNDFTDMFQLLNFDKFPIDYLVGVVAEEEVVKENPLCLKWIMSSMSEFIKKKSAMERESKILCLGGMETTVKVSEIYNLFEEKPEDFPDLPSSISTQRSLLLNGIIFCIGSGTLLESSVITNHVCKIDFEEGQPMWKCIETLKAARQAFGAAIYKDTIVVAGGDKGKAILSSTECYSNIFAEWKTIASLQQARSGHALVACDDCLYAVGGWDGVTLSSVERLYGLKETWEFAQSMHTSRRWLAAVNCKGFIYVIGGENDDNNSLKTVEKYDPAEKKWVYVSDMNIERSAHAACVLQDKIYVVGGVTKDWNVVKAIECYDSLRDTWSIVGVTNDELYNHSLVVM